MNPSKMTKKWQEVFEALSPYASSQNQCEEMTDAVMAVLNKNMKGPR